MKENNLKLLINDLSALKEEFFHSLDLLKLKEKELFCYFHDNQNKHNGLNDLENYFTDKTMPELKRFDNNLVEFL